MSDLIAPVKMLRWDTGTLTWISWDGSLTTGALVIGAVTQSGTWTVQPGNTANTTAWKVDGSAVTQPASLVTLPPLVAGTANIGDVDVLTLPAANPATAFGKTLTYVSINQSVAGTTILAAASVGNKHKIVSAIIVMSALGTVKFADGVGDLTGPMDLATNGGFVWPASIAPYTETAATNRALNLVTTIGAARGVVAILTEA